MFSSGELDPDFLENDFMKRIWQWKRVYQREMISPVGEAPSPAPFFEDKNKKE